MCDSVLRERHSIPLLPLSFSAKDTHTHIYSTYVCTGTITAFRTYSQSIAENSRSGFGICSREKEVDMNNT